MTVPTVKSSPRPAAAPRCASRQPRLGADQVESAGRLSGRTIRTAENLAAFAKDVADATGGKLQISAASRRLAVQGAAKSSARCRPGRRRSGEVLISIHENEDRDLRHRRRAVPGHQLSPKPMQALEGVEAGDREEARLAGHHAAVRGAVGAAGHLRQEGHQHDRRHEGPQMARLQCRHRAHRRSWSARRR